MSLLDPPFNILMAAFYDGLSSSNGMKIVGRNFAWIDRYAMGGTDIGGTCRYSMKTCGQVSKLAVLLASHAFATDAAGGAVEGTGSSPRIWMTQTSYENGTTYAQDSMNGNATAIVTPNNGFAQTDGVGISIPAATQFWLRHYLKIANLPTGTPTAAAIAGGSLAAQSWYYVVTRTEKGIESGPTAEFTATTASSNLAIAITIVDTASASADFYSIYRSSAAAGTKQFLGSTLGKTKRFVDDGSYTVDTTINPPAASTYDLNRLANKTGECSSHVSSSGAGTNFVAATGTFVNSSGGFVGGNAPLCVVGDDRSGKSVLILGDSIGAGRGFAKVTTKYPQELNMFDASFSDGEINSLNACYAGSYLKGLMTQVSAGAGRSRLKLIPYANFVIEQHGRNDIGLGSTWQQLASDKLKMAVLVKRCGGKFVVTTVLPRVTQTTGCVTIAGQTQDTNAERINYNLWVRAGCPVDGAGVPDMAGTASPLVFSYIDIAAPFEVDASNVVTLNGGYWKVPVAPAATFTLSGTPTTSSLPTTVSSMTFGENVSRVVKVTSGVRAGQYAVVSANTTSTLTIYNSGQTTLQSGVAVPYLLGAPAAGDTIEVYDVMANEGLHPSIYGHTQIAAVFRAWLLANVI